MPLSLGLGIVAFFSHGFTSLEASMIAEETLHIRNKSIFPDVNGKHFPPFSLENQRTFHAQNLANLCREDNNTQKVSDI